MKRKVKYCVEICIVIIVTSCVTSYLNINISTMKMRVANRHECMSLRNDVDVLLYVILRVANRHECMSLRNDVIGPG
jgi:hypothetical protein